jgi:uncharacterized phage-associated protein
MTPVANVHDVAAYIVHKHGSLSAMKLQKLVYYSQAWALVWDDRPLFPEPIEAWVNGPVVPALYERHRGQFLVTEWPYGGPSRLDEAARETIDIVLDHYGKLNAQQLSALTHSEAPWKDARRGVQPGERGHQVITLEAMMEYYSSLTDSDGEG